MALRISEKRRLKVLKLGCGGRHTNTTNGADFDCDHEYPWTCDECPINNPRPVGKAIAKKEV